MRVIHFSDTHLGHQQFGRTASNGLNQREQDHYDAFAAIIDHCIKERPDVVIHSGDLFDGVRPSNRALAVALSGFVRLSRAGIPTVIIAGNHEHPKMLETGSPMRLFEHLEHIHPVFKGKRESFDISGWRIHAVPQCSDNAALRAAVTSIETTGRDVLVLHGGVMGLEGFYHAEFNELSLDPAWFTGAAADRFGYVALGHHHGCTEVAPHAWYAGAPDRVSIRESGEEKGFLDVRLEPLQVTFVPVATRPYVDLPPIDATGLEGDALEALLLAAVDRQAPGAVVRLRVREVPNHLRGSLDLAAVRAAGAHLLDLDLRVEFVDEGRQSAAHAIGGLAEEFEAFAASHPMEGLDRQTIIEAARSLLAEAE